ncbi:MAG TPA: GNAT family N-acetyltransferase [Candidatus Saccharimonadaceae bacterium]|nr:GNAT family N-acetyltransferase [Candidatus Saccharimonadaceae bacterium]
MTVRPATTDDLPHVARLRSIMRGQPTDSEAIADTFSQLIASPHRVLLVCDTGSVLVGMAIVTLILRLPEKRAIIDELVVDPNSRGHSYGRQIIEACEKWACDHGATSIMLTSRPERVAANRLYQSSGFERYETNVYRKQCGVL